MTDMAGHDSVTVARGQDVQRLRVGKVTSDCYEGGGGGCFICTVSCQLFAKPQNKGLFYIVN
jgi:hypothetical protein